MFFIQPLSQKDLQERLVASGTDTRHRVGEGVERWQWEVLVPPRDRPDQFCPTRLFPNRVPGPATIMSYGIGDSDPDRRVAGGPFIREDLEIFNHGRWQTN